MIFRTLFFITLVLFAADSIAQQVINLYEHIPGAITDESVAEKSDTANGRIRTSRVTRPTITAFFPPKEMATGTAVIICPGGGYAYLVMNQEGTEVAEAFTKKGVAAFVLKYRLPNDKIMKDKSIGPLQDAQQAIKIVREHAVAWGIDSTRVGIMGFSAGGHLASTVSTHFADKVIENPGGINLRPDFSILVYPVISFTDSLAHKGSRKALLGEHPTTESMDFYSGEKQVTPTSPPAFLLHCGDDKVVPVGNSIAYYQALLRNGVPAEMHIYPGGGHGFGMNNKTTSEPWMDRCFSWMRANRWMK